MTNEQIARDVMGWIFKNETNKRVGFYSGNKYVSLNVFLPDFLNDHNAAMVVVEKMREDGYRYESRGLTNHMFKFFKDSGDEPSGFGSGPSLCRAICSAALMAKGE